MKSCRMLTLLLAVALILSVCSLSLAEEKTVTIGLALNTNVVDYDTNAFTLALEEEFGVNIEFLLMEDINQKLPVLVSSGSKLPDILCCSLDNATIWNWAQQGVLLPLTEYWKNADMTKELTQRVADLQCDPALVDAMLANVTMPDGEIYTLPSYDQNLWNLAPYRMRLNTKWLAEAGLEVPETMEDLKNVLIYFRDHDMNGNGDASDEIPLTGSYGTYGGNIEAYLLGAFVHANPAAAYINVEDGKIVPAYTTDACREGLAYIHEMYEEGLIDPLAFTQDLTQLKAVINGDDLLAGAVVIGSDSAFTSEDTLNAYTIISPVAGPNGVRLAACVPPTTTSKVFITCDAQDPELCFKMAEITYDTTWRAIFRNGVEGENWTNDPELISQYKLNFSTGDYSKVLYMVLDNVWGKVSNNIWNGEVMPFFNVQENIINQVTTQKLADLTEEQINTPSNQERHYYANVAYLPKEMPGTLIYSTEEIETLAEIQAAIDSYAKEMIMSFIVGNTSLDQWDSFQSELKNMGIDTYVAIMQAAYDRKS